MSELEQVLEEKKKLLEDKENLFEVRNKLASDAVFNAAKKQLTSWVGSSIALITVFAGVLSFFGVDYLLDRYVDAEVERQVENKVSEQSQQIKLNQELANKVVQEIIQSSNDGRLAIGALESELQRTEKLVSDILGRTEKLEQLLTRGKLISEVFLNTLYAMRSRTFLCGPDPSSLQRPQLRIGFTASYQIGNESYDNFRLPDPTQRFRIHVENDIITVGKDENTVECLRIIGDMDITNNATPAFTDIRDLPAIEGFYVDEISLAGFDDEEKSEAELSRFRKKWLEFSSVFVLLEVANHNLSFVRGPTPFIERKWIKADQDYILLDPVVFREDRSDPSWPILRVYYPLREPIHLDSLMK